MKEKERRKGIEKGRDLRKVAAFKVWPELPLLLWLGSFHHVLQGISVLFQDGSVPFQRTQLLLPDQVTLVSLFILAWLGVGKLLEQILYQGLLK